MARIGRGRVAALLLGLVVCASGAVTACAELPTSGPVETGRTEAPATGTIQYDASRPSAGTQPRELVQGFLQAGAAGLSGDNDFEVARAFLTPATSARWEPLARVLVAANDEAQTIQVLLPPDATDPGPSGSTGSEEAGGTVEPSAEELAQAERVSVVVDTVTVGSVDESGAYLPEVTRERSALTFGLVRVDGEWRIDSLPEGLLLTEGTFATVFRAVPVSFLSPDRSTLVPDVRYVPTRRATRSAVEHLLAGPTPWLAAAVETAVPAGLQIDPGRGVVVEESSGNVEVHLTGADVPTEERDLLYAQLAQTLTSIPSVWGVSVWFGPVPYEPAADVRLPEQAPAVGHTMVALSEGRLVTLVGEELTVHPVSVGHVDDDGGGNGAGDGGDAATGADGSGAAEPGDETEADASEQDAEPAGHAASWRTPALGYGTDPDVAVVAGTQLLLISAQGDERVLADGEDLLAPSFDRFGWVWSGTAEGLFAVRASDGERIQVPILDSLGDLDRLGDEPGLDGLGSAADVLGLRVSRDGARVLLTRRVGDNVEVSVHALVRTEDGAPRRVGEGIALAAFDDVSSAVWADSSTVVTLGTSVGDGPLLVRTSAASGPTSSLSATSQPVWVAAGDGVSQIFVATGEGRLLARAATRGWTALAEGISYPAFPG